MNESVEQRLKYERRFEGSGAKLVAGVDEAGRGSLAGPVAAGAVILPLGNLAVLGQLTDVRDSKLCTPNQRNALYDLVVEHAVAYACGMASSLEIDQMGIAQATRLAMKRAIEQLTPAPAALLIDYVRLRAVNLPQISIKKGELHSISIAAASIIAKVTRDRLMLELAEQHQQYGFAQNKGYGTRSHREALMRHGPSAIHRRTFAPVRNGLFDTAKAAR